MPLASIRKPFAPAKLAAAVIVACIAATTAAQAGRWTYHEDRNDGHILDYVEDGKAVFELACGRGFDLFAKHPAQAKTDGKARITLAAGAIKISLDGEFTEPADNMATNFRQAYLGYSKRDDRVYGKRWQELESRLLDVIDSRSGFTISAGEANYHVPAVDIDKWRRPFELCGYGFWVSPREFPSETN